MNINTDRNQYDAPTNESPENDTESSVYDDPSNRRILVEKGKYLLSKLHKFERRERTSFKYMDQQSDNTTKKSIIIAASIFAALLLIAGIVFLSIHSVLRKIEYVSPDASTVPNDISSIVLSDSDEEPVSGADVFDDATMDDVDVVIREAQVDENGLKYEEGVTNVLLLGTDGRVASNSRTRSDAILILSINDNTKKITITSIMRDTYVAIPGRPENEKITHAHAYGGAQLTVQTVQNNFGIRIDKFAEVNFYALMDIVDALGGVTVADVTDAEKKYLNNYIQEINNLTNCGADDGKLVETGENITLTGKQAMGYVRVRYTEGGDFERSARQREVLTDLIHRVREADYRTLLDVLNEVAENMATDYTEAELLKLAVNAGSYMNYEIAQQRIPVDGSYIGGIYRGSWVLRIDFDVNREKLYSGIFDEQA